MEDLLLFELKFIDLYLEVAQNLTKTYPDIEKELTQFALNLVEKKKEIVEKLKNLNITYLENNYPQINITNNNNNN